MKTLLNAKTFLATTALVATFGFGQQAISQTAVPVTAEVLNTVTVTLVNPLNFGTLAAVDGGTTNRATYKLDFDGTITDGTVVDSLTAEVDSALATPASLTLENGANGYNLTVQIVVDTEPVDGGGSGDEFTLSHFHTTRNGGAVNDRTAAAAATGYAFQFDSAYNGGVNELIFGATLETQSAAAVYADGTYTGGLTVTVSY